MTDPNEIADVLDKAADELLVHGWRGHPNYSEPGTLCLVEAVNAAANPTDFYRLNRDGRHEWFTCSAINAAAEAALCALADAGYAVIPSTRLMDQHPRVFLWNDARGRTEDEVHDALRSTAKELREQAS